MKSQAWIHTHSSWESATQHTQKTETNRLHSHLGISSDQVPSSWHTISDCPSSMKLGLHLMTTMSPAWKGPSPVTVPLAGAAGGMQLSSAEGERKGCHSLVPLARSGREEGKTCEGNTNHQLYSDSDVFYFTCEYSISFPLQQDIYIYTLLL